ncbi:DJ-1/PfpI family protein [Cryptosporangium sp. NPDC048952]|uniref:DJ-1/PfpI family protein n=1 Tax=Cryptosporangium sp. NPDC048952 TaxID=3363961 RepID=UPI003715E3FE
MQIAIVLYPRFTSLDVIGPYEVLARLPETEVVFVAEEPGLVTNDLGSLSVDAVARLEDVPAPDVVLIGGGPGQADQMEDGRLHQWLRAADRTSTWTTSVCTGSLVLAAAGLLEGRPATSHWGALEQLKKYGVTPSTERVVIDDKYVSAAGVSAGIDMALTLAGKLRGDDVAQMVQLIIEYAPEPPYSAGSMESAPPQVVELATQRLAGRFPDES